MAFSVQCLSRGIGAAQGGLAWTSGFDPQLRPGGGAACFSSGRGCLSLPSQPWKVLEHQQTIENQWGLGMVLHRNQTEKSPVLVIERRRRAAQQNNRQLRIYIVLMSQTTQKSRASAGNCVSLPPLQAWCCTSAACRSRLYKNPHYEPPVPLLSRRRTCWAASTCAGVQTVSNQFSAVFRTPRTSSREHRAGLSRTSHSSIVHGDRPLAAGLGRCGLIFTCARKSQSVRQQGRPVQRRSAR